MEDVIAPFGSATALYLIVRFTRARDYPHMLNGAMVLGAWVSVAQSPTVGCLIGALLVTALAGPLYWQEIKRL